MSIGVAAAPSSSQVDRFETDDGLLRGRSGGLIMATAVLFTVLVCYSDTFLSAFTMNVLSRQIGFFILVALAQAVCLVVGGMNLSVGAIGGFCAVVLGLSMDRCGMPAPLGIVLTLCAGAIAGTANGLLITLLRIDSFIVTLSMMFVFMGLRSGISGGSPYSLPSGFTVVGQQSVLGLPYVFLIAVAVLIGAS